MNIVSMRALTAGVFATGLVTTMNGIGAASAADPRGPHAQTRADLERSMKGEAFAHASYTYYGQQAEREGLSSAARLFKSTAEAELGEHFTEQARPAGLVGSDATNLQDAINGEGYEARDMYPRFAKEAKADGDTAAAELFSEIARDEGAHRQAFIAALRVVQTGKGTIPAPPSIHTVNVTAGGPKVRSQRTKANLDAALHGEALANAKYTLYAKHASAQGNAALARLFTGSADVELREHFADEAVQAGLVGTTNANLDKAIAGERYESTTMYPAFAKRADAVGDAKEARLFREIAADEGRHANAFQKARSEGH